MAVPGQAIFGDGVLFMALYPVQKSEWEALCDRFFGSWVRSETSSADSHRTEEPTVADIVSQ
jgi:hypothetical protein